MIDPKQSPKNDMPTSIALTYALHTNRLRQAPGQVVDFSHREEYRNVGVHSKQPMTE